jgi:hypothetical protein
VAEGGALVTSARPDPPGAPGRATYLAGSDERSLTGEYLAAVVRALPRRRVLVDVSPGDPALTARLGRHFERTLAIEPDPADRAALRRACPWAVPLDADPGDATADLVLCAQGTRSFRALSAAPPDRWRAAVLRMLGWAVPGGEVVLLLPAPESDRARLLHRLTGVRPDVTALRDALLRDASPRAGGGPVGRVWLETLECRFRTRRLGDAVEAVGFLLGEAGPYEGAVPQETGGYGPGERGFPADAGGHGPGERGFPAETAGCRFGERGLSPDAAGHGPGGRAFPPGGAGSGPGGAPSMPGGAGLASGGAGPASGGAAPPGATRPPSPTRQALAELLRREFTRPDGTVSLGCALDVLRVRRAGRPRAR